MKQAFQTLNVNTRQAKGNILSMLSLLVQLQALLASTSLLKCTMETTTLGLQNYLHMVSTVCMISYMN